MKRTLVAAILGLSAVASSFGQGHITFNNYTTLPYNQIVWNPSGGYLPGTAVVDGTVQVQLFYGEGVIVNQNLLTAGVTMSINPAVTYNPGDGYGGGGYVFSAIQTLGTWAANDIFTFQLRAVVGSGPGGNVGPSFSTLWQEQTQIAASSGPANTMATFPGLFVNAIPEPSSVALIGLGLGSLLMARRRK